MQTLIARLAGLSLALLLTHGALATSIFSFTGNFTSDTDVQFFNFTLDADTPNVYIRTWSDAGGTNGNGQVIAGGGFEPHLQVYASDGSAFNPGFITNCTDLGLPQNATTGTCDVLFPNVYSPAYIPNIWPAGNYILALTLDANPALGNLSDGFFQEGVMGLTPGQNFSCSDSYQGDPDPFDADAPFCSTWTPGVQLDSHWALDIGNVDSAELGMPSAVPEPGTAIFAIIGLALVAGRRLRGRAR